MRRRLFLFGAGGALAGAQDSLTLGVIGSGGRGTYVMQVFQKNSTVQVGAICDVYEPNLERALSLASKAQSQAPRAYRAYKELLEDRTIQAVLIATPEHWHHRMVLDALAAGKDVYVEKPLCQTPAQGVELMEAEARSRQIVQVGMQRRSYDLYLEGRRQVASGRLGTVRMVRSWWLNNYLEPGRAARLEGPLDWDQWFGPGPRRSPDANLFRNWRFFREYAGGIVADQGAHVYDGLHLLMGAGFPRAVTAAGGRPHKDGVDTPESVVVTAEYAEDFIAVFTINYAAMRYASRNDQMNHLDGDRARMDIGRESMRIYDQGKEEAPVQEMVSQKGFNAATDAHVANFLDCIRTRKTPNAPIRLGFQAALVVQLANLSLAGGKRQRWNETERRVEA